MWNIYLTICLIVLISCGKAPEYPQPVTSASEPYLPDRIEIKEELPQFDKRGLHLKCDLRIMGKIIDEINWTPAYGHELLRLINFRVGKEEKVILIKFPELNPSGDFSIFFRRDSRKILINGSVHKLNEYHHAHLSENVVESLYNEMNELSVEEEFSCLLVRK
jgi:hypothetical protein